MSGRGLSEREGHENSGTRLAGDAAGCMSIAPLRGGGNRIAEDFFGAVDKRSDRKYAA